MRLRQGYEDSKPGGWEDYLTAWGPRMNADQRRRWNVWEDFMREWIRRDDFHLRIEALLVGEDPDFQDYFRRLVLQERGSMLASA